MLRSIVYILFFSLLYNQTSSLSLYGLGERINSYDANSIALGDMKLFSSNDIGFVLSSPSSYYRNHYANLSMTMLFNKVESRNISKLSSNNFSHVSFGFPITKNQFVLLSFNPVYRSVINITDVDFNYTNIDYNSDEINDPVAYKTSYDFSGGLSEFSISLSSKINQKFSMGFKFGTLFGSSSRKKTLNYYKLYDEDGELTYPLLPEGELRAINHEYSSNSYMVDLRYSQNNLELATYVNYAEKMTIKVDYDNFNRLIYNADNFKEFGFGIKYSNNNTLNYMFEFHFNKPFKVVSNEQNSIEIFYNRDLEIISYHIGMSNKISLVNSKKINTINLNLGLYHKDFYNYNIDIREYGISFGLGLNYLNNESFNIGVKTGIRESQFNEFEDERYVKLIFSLISNNQWFMNERK